MALERYCHGDPQRYASAGELAGYLYPWDIIPYRDLVTGEFMSMNVLFQLGGQLNALAAAGRIRRVLLLPDNGHAQVRYRAWLPGEITESPTTRSAVRQVVIPTNERGVTT